MIHLLDKREARVYKKGFSIIARFEMEGIWYQRCLCARTGNVFLLME